MRTTIALLLLGASCASRAPDCGAMSCPAGTYSVSNQAYDGDGEATEVGADVAFTSFEKGECAYTCVAVAACPDWTIPAISETCYSCSYLLESGEVVQLGGTVGWSTCEDGTFPPSASGSGESVVVVGSRGAAYVDPGVSYIGTDQLYWERANGEQICTATYDITYATPTEECIFCDWAFDVTINNEVLEGDPCDQLFGGSLRHNGEEIHLGYTRELSLPQYPDELFQNVLWVRFEDTWYPYGSAVTNVADVTDAGPFLYDKVWSAFYSDDY